MSRRLLSIALASAVLATVGGFSGIAQAGDSAAKVTASTDGIRQLKTFSAFKSDSGRLAKSDKSLFHLSGSKLTPVVVKLDYDAIGSYRGYLPGYAATSPGTTHKSLKQNKAAVDKYSRYIGKMDDKARSAVAKLIPQAKVTQSLKLAYGGFSALVPANQISKLLKVPGVAAVQRDKLNKLQAVVQEPWQFVGSEEVWPSLGGLPNAGSNVTVADLDSGIWPENPMLADNGTIPAPSGGPYACEFGDGVNPLYGPAFTCNDKLVGAHVDLTTYLAVLGAVPGEFCVAPGGPCSARDSEGHGTHTATTAAGAFVDHAPIFGIDRGPTSGIAPGAHVIAYRVCLEQGCFGSDSAAAVGQAIADGANVLNFSISGGKNPYTDPVELAFRDFYAAGGLANASAGNAGPGAATADHGGPWENTVGASYPSRLYLTTLHLTSSDASTLDVVGSSITTPISSPTPVVMAASVTGHSTDSTCSIAFAAASVTGKIVACARGNPAGRAASSFNVKQGGAAGMVIYNPTHQDLFTDNFWVPTVMLDAGTTPQYPHDTTPFLAFMGAHPNVTATFATGARTAVTGDVMTTFSSRGPLGDWIKPDITAPGIEILAGNTPEPAPGAVASGPPGENFQAIAGTSMSAPHATGVAALVFAAHPTWTPGQVKSAMMTSSSQNVFQPDGVSPANPFNDGAGSIRVNRAVKPTVTFDESAADYAALASDPFGRIDANLPSVNAPLMPGTITTTRTVRNVSEISQQFDVHTTATGGSITVSPSSFNLTPHGTKNLTITIHGESLAPAQYFGSITLDATNPSANDVYLPVAFVKTAGATAMTSSCAPPSIPKGAVTHCTTTATNNSANAAVTEIGEHFNAVGQLFHQNFTENHNGASSGSLSSGNDGYDWSGTLSPAVPPHVDSITNITGDGPDGGYLETGLLGVGPIAGVGDDTITNFNVPTYWYGRESYTQIGVVSNGYVVVGGGASADIVFTPQHFPNPARPNNTLALMWSDLNPAAAGAIRISTLTGGPFRWLVVDYDGVKNFGNATTHSFEMWIQLESAGFGTGPGSEGVTYSYGPNLTIPGDGPGLGNAGSGDPDSGQNSGAENRDGSSGANISPAPPNGSEWFVDTTGPAPGGTVTITYDVKGKKVGDYTLTTNMTSDQVPGTTVTKQPLTVT